MTETSDIAGLVADCTGTPRNPHICQICLQALLVDLRRKNHALVPRQINPNGLAAADLIEKLVAERDEALSLSEGRLVRLDAAVQRALAAEQALEAAQAKVGVLEDDGRIRIALWNACRQRGMSQDAIYPLINDVCKALAEGGSR